MKLFLPLLLTITLTTAFPLPALLRNAHPATPATHLLAPAPAPSHQRALVPFDNHPLTPAADLTPTAALASPKPLTSAYLLSLTAALPAAPTSSLERLRKEDAERYWAETIVLSERPGALSRCAEAMGFRPAAPGHPIHTMRQYDDMIVVGIVVLFLIAVMVVEITLKEDGDAVADQVEVKHYVGEKDANGQRDYVVYRSVKLQSPPPARKKYMDEKKANKDEMCTCDC